MHILEEIREIWGGDSYDFSLNQSGSMSTIEGLKKQIEELKPDEDTIIVAIPLSKITTEIKRIKIK